MIPSYHIEECLHRCLDLQRKAARWAKEYAIGELMRMAVLDEPSEAMVIALCRMLFVSREGEPLRPPCLGEPWFLGDTTEDHWPIHPLHLHEGVPLFVVRGWSLAGLPERAAEYLAFCLLHGVWNEKPFRMVDRQELTRVTEHFIENGPWKRQLSPSEQTFLLSQIQSNEEAMTNVG
jgi:hypothetical protein